MEKESGDLKVNCNLFAKSLNDPEQVVFPISEPLSSSVRTVRLAPNASQDGEIVSSLCNMENPELNGM